MLHVLQLMAKQNNLEETFLAYIWMLVGSIFFAIMALLAESLKEQFSGSYGWPTLLDEGVFDRFACKVQCRRSIASGCRSVSEMVHGTTHPNDRQYHWDDTGHSVDDLGDTVTSKQAGRRASSSLGAMALGKYQLYYIGCYSMSFKNTGFK